ncbi:MAG: glycosyltransferase, partial [bacterium]|nr:glycosyltransferase [bacterium]
APMRQYYIYRNSIIFYKRYAMLYRKRFLILRTIIATRRIFLYKDKSKKFRAAFKGIFAGQRYSPRKDKQFQKTISLLQGGEQNQ